MVSTERWQAAQHYERAFWEGQARGIAEGALDQMVWYQWRADRLVERLRDNGLGAANDGTARVIEVGSGPVGIATFFPARERVAIDPLNDFYDRDATLAALRNPDVRYRTGTGELLPAESGTFDLAIIENCIDHVQDVDAVMRELHRVLVPGGVLFLAVNCRTRVGFVVHRALSKLRLDPGHPHSFTPARLQSLLRRHRFAPAHVKVGSYRQAFLEQLRTPDLKARTKAVMGVSEFEVSALAVRKG